MAGRINFFQEDIAARINGKRAIKAWIEATVQAEQSGIEGDLNFVFCSDEYLLNINKQYLDHDYYTDIITFGNACKQGISGDIYISIDRVKDNANAYKSRFKDELHRVIIHGVLHLIGYKDKSPKESKIMREKENSYLALRSGA